MITFTLDNAMLITREAQTAELMCYVQDRPGWKKGEIEGVLDVLCERLMIARNDNPEDCVREVKRAWEEQIVIDYTLGEGYEIGHFEGDIVYFLRENVPYGEIYAVSADDEDLTKDL